MESINFCDSKDDIKRLEEIRLESFKARKAYDNIEDSLIYKKIMNGDYLVVGLSLENKLIGGCVISSSLKSLYIEYLFIDPKYQHEGYGTSIMQYVLRNKNAFEDYYHMKFTESMLEEKECEEFYKKLEYRNSGYLMKKKI